MSTQGAAGSPRELDRWNTRFAAPDYVFGKQPNAFLAEQAGKRLKPGMSVLCVADGEGRNSTWLASQGYAVTAFDYSPVGLAKSRALAAERGVQVDLQQGDINAWDWDAVQYDAVAAIFIQFSTPPERARVFAGLVRALKPGGLLILQGYGTGQLAYGTGGPKNIEQLYTDTLLRGAFAALDILHLATHDEEVDEGPGHSGMSALVDLVARRPA